MVVCAVKSCVNSGVFHIGVSGIVRIICLDDFDIIKKGGNITEFKPINPQERFILSSEDNKI